MLDSSYLVLCLVDQLFFSCTLESPLDQPASAIRYLGSGLRSLWSPILVPASPSRSSNKLIALHLANSEPAGCACFSVLRCASIRALFANHTRGYFRRLSLAFLAFACQPSRLHGLQPPCTPDQVVDLIGALILNVSEAWAFLIGKLSLLCPTCAGK